MRFSRMRAKTGLSDVEWLDGYTPPCKDRLKIENS